MKLELPPYIATADTHHHPFRICSRNGGADRRQDGLSAVAQTLQFAEERGCAWVHHGDVKHVRGTWDQECLSGLLRLFDQYRYVPKLMLAGNGYHDGTGVKELGGSGLDPFRSHAIVIDLPCVVPGIDLCEEWSKRSADSASFKAWFDHKVAFWPWQPTFEAMPTILGDSRASGVRHLIAHGYLREAVVGNDERSLPGVGTPMADFGLVGAPNKRVFDFATFGDVHHQQMLGDMTGRKAAMVFYPGSPYAQNWGELEPDKGCLYIHEDGLVEPLKVQAPRFVICDLNTKEKLEHLPKTSIKGNFVRFKVPTDLLIEYRDKLAKYKAECGARFFEIMPYSPDGPEPAEALFEHTDEVSDEDLLDAYLKTVPPPQGVPPAAILEAGRRLLKQ